MASLLLTLPEQPDDADTPLRNVVMGPLVPDVDDFSDASACTSPPATA